ncbi:MAG: amidase [Thiomonas sp.]
MAAHTSPPSLPGSVASVAPDGLELAARIRRGDISAAQALHDAIGRCDAVNPQINAVINDLRVRADAQLRHAQALQGIFAGVPFLLKDLGMDLSGVPTSQGNARVAKIAAGQTDAIVRRWEQAGLVIFGKTNTPELGLKAITEPAAFGPTRNPWNLDHTPGGSSGGAAAAVAAGIVPVAAAADGGGSIRIPAAYCGLFGLKPSRGRVSCAPQFDEMWEGAVSANVISRSVRDSAAMLDVLAGAEPGDPFIVRPPAGPYAREVGQAPGHLRIALSTASPIGGAVDAAWSQAATDCALLLQSLGHSVERVDPVGDGMQLARDYLTMYFGQVAAQLQWWQQRGVPASAFETDTQALGLIGRGLAAGDYALARARWNAPMRALGSLFSRFDLYITPTCAQPPARIGQLAAPAWQQSVLRLILQFGLGGLLRRSGLVEQLAFDNLHRTPFTQLANLTGTPAMSVPWSLDAMGLPVGVQCIAAWGREDLLLRVASQLEQARPWAHWRPPVFAQ